MARSSLLASPMPRIRAWLDRWGDVVPLLLAEFIVWLGFGALLPVLPLYFTEQGVDLALLGLVIAAWPAARLVGEPIFGYLADRTARVPADGHRADRDRDLQLPAAGLHRAARVRPVARRIRAGDRRLRPGGARLPDRCHAARPSRRGVRAVRRGPDGRAAARARHRRARRPLLRRDLVRLRVRCRRRVPGGDPDRPPWSRDRGADAPGPGGRLDPVPARGAIDDPAGRHRHRRRSRRTRGDRPVGPDATLEPGPDRGPGHQRGRLLRGRDLRGHLEPLPPEARGRPRPDRADLRDVRAAGAAAVAVRRPAGRPARLAGVHRHRVDPAGGHGPRLHAGSPIRSWRSR